jgi:hypothetical protein
MVKGKMSDPRDDPANWTDPDVEASRPVNPQEVLPALSEKQFRAQVVEYADLCRWLVHWNDNSRYATSGFPDLVLVRERIIFAELKTDVGRLRKARIVGNRVVPGQDDWLNALNEAGAEAYVWRPRDWAQIERVLA